MQIELISTSVEDKGKYKMMVVTHRNSEGKLGEKKLMSFGAGADVFKFLTSAPPAKYDVGTNKNDQGYWDWVSINPAGASAAAAPQSAKAGGATPAPRSTYETPEERAIKQKYIVRQSSIGHAIELLGLNSKKVPTTEEVITVAKQFEDYVFGVTTVATSNGSIEELHDDIPF
jgi:hypothetical protein